MTTAKAKPKVNRKRRKESLYFSRTTNMAAVSILQVWILSQSLLLRKWDWRKRSPSPRPSPPGEGEARTVPGIFTPFGVELLHGDSRRRLLPGWAQQKFLQPGQVIGVNQVNARIE